MEKWLSGLEQMLPHWLAKTQTQWAQWVYVIWQLLRGNPVILLVLSYVPFMLSQCRSNKAVVVLGQSRDYLMAPHELMAHFEDGPVRLKNLEEITRHPSADWLTVKHHDYYYLVHIQTLCDLTKCTQLFGENIIFVERLLRISGSLAVGKEISETEAYEKIFAKRCYCGKGSNLVVPTSFNYVDFSSKFWLVISSLPILFQAKNYVKLSNLLSLMIILLDLNRSRLYRLYDRPFNAFTKIVKLNVFKERTSLYDFFSIFSNRWRYTDTVMKYSYAVKPGEARRISWYTKMKKPDDLKIVKLEAYGGDTNDQNLFMEIAIDEAHCYQMKNVIMYPEVELNRPVDVL